MSAHLIDATVLHPGRWPSVNALLWALQGILAAVFLATGLNKIIRSKTGMVAMSHWWQSWPVGAIKALGVAELLGAAGLLLPWATGIARVLTPVAAIGLAVLLVGAAATHLRFGEYRVVPAVVLLLAAAIVVAVGRLH
jgi:hypothetical protein